MKSFRIFLICWLIIHLNLLICENKKPKIAIIGAGIGGTSCALFLKDFLEDKVEIHIYEQYKIGGRLASVEYNKTNFDLGRIFSENDKYANELVQRFGLTKVTPRKMYLYKKNQLHTMTLPNRLQLLRSSDKKKRFDRLLDDASTKFDNIYKFQTSNRNAPSLDLLFSSYMLEYSKKSTDQWLASIDISEEFLDICKSRLIIDYSQLLEDVHSFAGFISLKKIDKTVYALKEGADFLAKKCYSESKAKFHFEKVVKIEREFLTHSKIISKERLCQDQDQGEGHVERKFDYVVFAAPLAENNLKNVQFNKYKDFKTIQGAYNIIAITILKGEMKKNIFGFGKNPKFVVFLENSITSNIISILKLKPSKNNLWKIESRKRLTLEEMKKIFKIKKIFKEWQSIAYPDYNYYKGQTEKIIGDDKTFLLDENLYYINSIEWAGSTIEMSLIGAKNVAIMILRKIQNSKLQSGKFLKKFMSFFTNN